jgi:hypothetical protein
MAWRTIGKLHERKVAFAVDLNQREIGIACTIVRTSCLAEVEAFSVIVNLRSWKRSSGPCDHKWSRRTYKNLETALIRRKK